MSTSFRVRNHGAAESTVAKLVKKFESLAIAERPSHGKTTRKGRVGGGNGVLVPRLQPRDDKDKRTVSVYNTDKPSEHRGSGDHDRRIHHNNFSQESFPVVRFYDQNGVEYASSETCPTNHCSRRYSLHDNVAASATKTSDVRDTIDVVDVVVITGSEKVKTNAAAVAADRGNNVKASTVLRRLHVRIWLDN